MYSGRNIIPEILIQEITFICKKSFFWLVYRQLIIFLLGYVFERLLLDVNPLLKSRSVFVGTYGFFSNGTALPCTDKCKSSSYTLLNSFTNLKH